MKRNSQHSIDFAFVLLLFCILTMCSLAVVYIGSQVYSSTATTMENQYSISTATDYILEKTRQTLASSQIEIKKSDHDDILCLHETYDQKPYTTYIYVYQGQLKELLISDQTLFQKENGETIMNADNLQLNLDGQLLSITLTIDGKSQTSYITLPGGVS